MFGGDFGIGCCWDGNGDQNRRTKMMWVDVEPTIVTNCEGCPFCYEDGYQPRCVMDEDNITLASDMIRLPDVPPDWCLLRKQEIVISLKLNGS